MLLFHLFLDSFQGTFFVRADNFLSINDTLYGSMLVFASEIAPRLMMGNWPYVLAIFYLLSAIYNAMSRGSFSSFSALNLKNPFLVVMFLFMSTTLLFKPTTVNVVELNSDYQSAQVDELTVIDQLHNVPRLLILPSTIANAFIYGVSHSIDSSITAESGSNTYNRFDNMLNRVHLGQLFAFTAPPEQNFYYYPNRVDVDSLPPLRKYYLTLGEQQFDKHQKSIPTQTVSSQSIALAAASLSSQFTRDKGDYKWGGTEFKEFKDPPYLHTQYPEDTWSITSFFASSEMAMVGINKVGVYTGGKFEHQAQFLSSKTKEEERPCLIFSAVSTCYTLVADLSNYDFFLPGSGVINGLKSDADKIKVCNSLGDQTVTGLSNGDMLTSSRTSAFIYKLRWDADLEASCSGLKQADSTTSEPTTAFLTALKSKASTAQNTLLDALSLATPKLSPKSSINHPTNLQEQAQKVSAAYYHLLRPEIPADLAIKVSKTIKVAGNARRSSRSKKLVIASDPSQIQPQPEFKMVRKFVPGTKLATYYSLPQGSNTFNYNKNPRLLQFILASNGSIKSSATEAGMITISVEHTHPDINDTYDDTHTNTLALKPPASFLNDINFDALLKSGVEMPTPEDNLTLHKYDFSMSKILLAGSWNRSDSELSNRTEYLKTVFYNSLISYSLLTDRVKLHLIENEDTGAKTQADGSLMLSSADLYLKVYQELPSNNYENLVRRAKLGINQFYGNGFQNDHAPDVGFLSTTATYLLFQRYEDLLKPNSAHSKKTCASLTEKTYEKCNDIVFRNALYQVQIDNLFSNIDTVLFTSSACLYDSDCSTGTNLYKRPLSKASLITPRIVPYITYRIFSQSRAFPSSSIFNTSEEENKAVAKFLRGAENPDSRWYQKGYLDWLNASFYDDETKSKELLVYLNDKAHHTKNNDELSTWLDTLTSPLTSTVSIISGSLDNSVLVDLITSIFTGIYDLISPIYLWGHDLVHGIPYLSEFKIWINSTIINLLNVVESGSLRWMDTPSVTPESSTSLDVKQLIPATTLLTLSSYVSLATTDFSVNTVIPGNTHTSMDGAFYCGTGFSASYVAATSAISTSNCNNPLLLLGMLAPNITPFFFFTGNPQIDEAPALSGANAFKISAAISGDLKTTSDIENCYIWNDLFSLTDKPRYLNGCQVLIKSKQVKVKTGTTGVRNRPKYETVTQSVAPSTSTPITDLSVLYIGFNQALQNIALKNSLSDDALYALNKGKWMNFAGTLASATAIYTIAATGVLTAVSSAAGRVTFNGLWSASSGTVGKAIVGLAGPTALAGKFAMSAIFSSIESIIAPLMAILFWFAVFLLAIVLLDLIIFYFMIRKFIEFARNILTNYALPMTIHFIAIFVNLIKYIFKLYRPSTSPEIATVFEETFENSFIDSFKNLFITSFLLSLTVYIFNEIFSILWSNVSNLAVRSVFESGAPSMFESILAFTILFTIMATGKIMELIDLLTPKQKTLTDLMGELKSKG